MFGRAILNLKMRYLAIDYGTKRTGLAICDADETIASPLTVIHGQKELLERIARLVETEGVGAIVLGFPINMDDSKGPQAKITLKFAEKLRKSLQIPVHLQDERLSSFSAEEKLASAGITKAAQKDCLDAIAAAEILEAFLEQKHNTSEPGNNPIL
jgi:putative Holliday junction resolvase